MFFEDFIQVLCLETPQMSLHYLGKLVVDLACAQKIDFISEAFSSPHVSTLQHEKERENPGS